MWKLGMRHATATRPPVIYATLPSTAGMATIVLRVWTIMAALVCVKHHATGPRKNGATSGLMGKRGMDGLVMDAGLAIGATPLAQHHQQTMAMACRHQEHHHQQGWSAQDPLATV